MEQEIRHTKKNIFLQEYIYGYDKEVRGIEKFFGEYIEKIKYLSDDLSTIIKT